MSWRVLSSDGLVGNPSKVLRVVDPLQRMEAAGLVERVSLESLIRRSGTEAFLDTTALESIDLVFLHVADVSAGTRTLLVPFLERARDQGTAIVCDSDDPYFVPADGCSFQAEIAPNLAAIEELCSLAHVVSVTTESLRREFEGQAERIVVVPNHLDARFGPSRTRTNERVKIGWCGGPTHTDDLAAVLPAIARLQVRQPVDFVMFGMFDRNFEASASAVCKIPPKKRAHDAKLAAFGRFADALRGVHYEHVPSTSYADFPRRLAELDFDIGLCPLIETRFNRCRSAVKFYQYANAGTLTLASDSAAYRGECSSLVGSTSNAWFEALSRFVGDEDLRAKELEKQREFVLSQRNWEIGVKRYEQLFRTALEAASETRRVRVR
ncbi:MAG: hypothetical protein SGI72_01090 [Planctomycetota bacterium]|nr:hypothetical protein [Planctomycetota bacterium]